MTSQAIKIGLIGGVVAVLLSLIGMVEAFSQRHIISNVISMGHTLLLLIGVSFGYFSAKRTRWVLLNSLISGLLVGTLLALLVLLGNRVDLRSIFKNASPVLYECLTFKQGLETGSILLLLSGALSGLLGSLFYLLPGLLRRMLVASLGSVIAAGVVQDLLRPTFAAWGPLAIINDWLFTANGVTSEGAIALFLIIAFITLFWARKGEAIQTGIKRLPPKGQRALRISTILLLILILLVLPQILGLFLSEVLTIVGLYVLLGLGLNIVVGYAGLLDLGYVAFFAIGAYVTAVLTSPELGFFNLTFWEALPFAVFMGILAGVILGVPVLKMRGDYLAITTLGFGEIIRILVLSDFLRPWLGGLKESERLPEHRLAPSSSCLPSRSTISFLRAVSWSSSSPFVFEIPVLEGHGRPFARTRMWPRPWGLISSPQSFWPLPRGPAFRHSVGPSLPANWVPSIPTALTS